MVKNLIVGIDPGTTVGIAILDLKRDILNISSSKNFSVDNIVEHLSKFGTPIIIATDVSNVHQTVEKISSSFQCKTFAPAASLSIKEKNEITKEYSFNNAHERDALASALKAYDHYKTKFENIDARLEDLGAKNLSSAVKTLVLRDFTVKNALNILTKKEEPEEKKIVKKEIQKKVETPEKISLERTKEYNKELLEKIKLIEKENEMLKRKNKKILNEIDIETRRSEIIQQKKRAINSLKEEIKSKEEKILEFQQVIRDLKGIRTLELSEEAHTVKVLDYFTREEIRNLDTKFKIKRGDIVYIKDPSGGGGSTAELLVEKQIKALIVEDAGRMSHNAKDVFENESIPLLNLNTKIVENFGIVDKKEFQDACFEWKTKTKIKTAEKKERWLNKLLKDYKKERIKKLK